VQNMRGAARVVVQSVERCLWVIGFVALAVWLAVWLNARQQQAEGSRELDRFLEGHQSVLEEHAAAPLHSRPGSTARMAPGALIGRIEIPRLKMSTVVFEGTGDDVLRIGVGHLAGSPLPGEVGNVVLAAHRDTYFRSLRDIRDRDRINVVTPTGTRRYRVESITIVEPNHTEVLAQGPETTLTLVTCYPFTWFGHAPKRFIVRAEEIDEHPFKQERSKPVATTVATPPRVKPIAKPLAVEPVEETIQEPQPDVPAEMAEATTQLNGGRVVRGLRKLKPRRLFARSLTVAPH
jgi:sortase A